MQELSLYTNKVKPWCNIRVDDLIVDGTLSLSSPITDGAPIPIFEIKSVRADGFLNGQIITDVLYIKQGKLITWVFPSFVVPLGTGNPGLPIILSFDAVGSILPEEARPAGGYANCYGINLAEDPSAPGSIQNNIGYAKIDPLTNNKIELYPIPDLNFGWVVSAIGSQEPLTNSMILQYTSL